MPTPFETEVELGDSRCLAVEWSLTRCDVHPDAGLLWTASAQCQVWRYVRLRSGSVVRTARLHDPFELEASGATMELAARAVVLGAITHALKWD